METKKCLALGYTILICGILAMPLQLQAKGTETVSVLTNMMIRENRTLEPDYYDFVYNEDGLLSELHTRMNIGGDIWYDYYDDFSYNERKQVMTIEKREKGPNTSDIRQVGKTVGRFGAKGRLNSQEEIREYSMDYPKSQFKYDKRGYLKKVLNLSNRSGKWITSGCGPGWTCGGTYECDENGRIIKYNDVYELKFDKQGNYNYNDNFTHYLIIGGEEIPSNKYKTIYDKTGNLIRVQTTNQKPNFEARSLTYKKITVKKELADRIEHQQYCLKYYRARFNLPMMLW